MQEWIVTHWLESALIAAFAGSTIIQISPLKINPWSTLAAFIGRAINKEMMSSVSEMKSNLDKHIQLDDERFIKQCRLRVLRFNDEILQGQRHTKEHFDEVLDDVTEYERYCELHPGYKNSKATMAISNVEAIYQKCLAEKSFL